MSEDAENSAGKQSDKTEGDGERNESAEKWIIEAQTKFKSLSLDEQVKFFGFLLEGTTPEVRYKIFKEVHKYFHHDILVFLPVELQEYICHYIDVVSLIQASCVNKEWNRVIDSLSDVWRRKYFLLGNKQRGKEERDWKAACLRTLKLRTAISNGSAYHHHNVRAICLSSDQITGLDCCKDLLIACSDDQVGVWSTKDYELISIFTVPYRVSCLKIDIGDILACGHSSGHITTWSLNYRDHECRPASRLEYRGHTGVVISVSLSAEIDLLVSGATDYTAKLWCISTGQLVRTIVEQSRWIIQVTLLPVYKGSNPKTLSKDKNSLLIKTRDQIKIFSWCAYFDCCPYGDVNSLEDGVVQYPLNAVHNFQTPGCFVQGGNVVYINQTLARSDEPGNAEIVFENLEKQQCTKRIRSFYKVRKLLAVGDRFAVLLLPHCDNFMSNLLIVEISTGEVVGGTIVPHSSSSTPDLAQIVMGDEAWLSDLSQLHHEDILLAAGLFHGQIRVITWYDPNRKFTG
ncbi:F-box/WD repeat-containing protein 2-like isoform X1 [Schistocerca americana]|uniref:F-box/WD repeat-containing protein 2-like n=1 Tax=Schistocerca piceifrons TaxID=274613 RepID=UPI001F4FAF22|nr:F-box/WD repeat-containing protein 2-like isoform X1 [Schistocerca americana]XP_047121893.1 F-box/WD repeat-containing protein 2-like [Schistocerca piceifrons]XP_049937812.1 F-box/WD repeat-containing protein 2-like [Schistocerca serialis cubense]